MSVYPGDWGSSGMLARNSSSFFLNSGSSTSVIFRSCCGKQLKSWAPCTLRLPSRSERTRAEDDLDIGGTTHCLPFRGVNTDLIIFSSVVSRDLLELDRDPIEICSNVHRNVEQQLNLLFTTKTLHRLDIFTTSTHA